MVKTPQSPLMVISHKNTSAIHKQKSARRQARVVENSQHPNEKLPFTPGIKENKLSTIDTNSKKNSIQVGKVSKKRYSTAKRKVEVKRAGRGKKGQRRNAKLPTVNVLLTDLDSIMSSTLIKNNRGKVVKAVKKMAKQKSVILNEVKPTRRKSLNSLGEVSTSNFSLISEVDSHRKGKKKIATLPNPHIKRKQSITSFFVENQKTKNPELNSNVGSIKSSSDFAASVSRKQSFQEKTIQVTSSHRIETSIASLRFERTERKEQNDSKMSKHTEFMSQNVNYIAPKNVSFSKTLTHTETSESKNIKADKSLKLQKPAAVKDNITEDKVLQPRVIKARNHAKHVLVNKDRNKPEKRKAERKSQFKKVGTATKFSRKKRISLLSKKQKASASVVRNSRPLRSSSQKSPHSYIKHTGIPLVSSVDKKSKYRGVTGEKKTAVVKVSEISVNIHKRSQNRAIKTNPVNKLSSSLTLTSLQTGKGKQVASLTQTAKESVVRKKRRLTPKEHLPQKKSSRAIKQYASLLAIEVTPIRSVVEMSPMPVTSSPAIVSSVSKATGQTTPTQAKKRKNLNQRGSLSLHALPSENISRQSYSSKYTSTPILAYSQSELLQRKRNVKTDSSLSSTENRKNASLSNTSISARSVAKPVSQMTNVTDIAFPSSIKKEVQKISAIGKKTPRLFGVERVLAIGKKTSRLSGVERVSAIGKKTPRLSEGKRISAIGKKTPRLSEGKRISAIGKKTPSLSEGKRILAIGKKTPRLSEGKRISAIGKKTPRLSEGKRISAIGKKTPRLSEGGKKRKPVTSARNVGRLSHSNIEDNIELIDDILLSQATNSKKFLSSVHHGSPKDFLRKGKSLISSRNRGSLGPSKVVQKPALRRVGKKGSLPAVSVKNEAENSKDSKIHRAFSAGKKDATKSGVNKHSIINAQLEVKTKARKPSFPAKQNIGTARTAVDAKVNLSYPEQKRAFKVVSRQKVTEDPSFELQELPLVHPKNKTSKLAEIKTISLKKSGKLPTKVDKRTSVTKITDNSVKPAEVQGNTMSIPNQTDTSKPVRLINEVQQAIFSPSQKKIFTQSKKKVTKAVHSKRFINEKRPKLLSEGGIKKRKQNRKRLSLGSVTKVEMMNWLTPGQEARYAASSQNLKVAKRSVTKKHKKLPKIQELKSASLSQKGSSPAKTTESEKIDLVSPRQKKLPKPTIGYKIQRTKSSKSPWKTEKKTQNKIADNDSIKKVNPKLSKRARTAKLIVPSARITRLRKGKLTQSKTLSLKKSGKLPTKVDKRTSLTRITGNLGKTAEVQGNAMAIPKQTKTSKPIRLINEVQQAISSQSQKNIFTQRKKKATKATNSKMFANEKRPKLLSEGGITKSKQNRKKLSHRSVTKAEMMNWLTPGQNKAYFLANVGLLPRTSKQEEASKLMASSVRIIRLDKGKSLKRMSFSQGQKKAPEALPHGRCQLPRTKSSTSAKEKGKKAFNKSPISGQIFSHKVSSDKVKLRKSNLSLPKIKGVDKSVETDNIVLPMQKEESELLLSGYKIQKNKSSAQKKTGRKKTIDKSLGKIPVSKKLRPKLSARRRFVTSSPNISRSIKTQQICVISSEQTEAPQPLPGRNKTQKTKMLSPSKKVRKKKMTIKETSKLLSSKVSRNASAMKSIKSVSVSPKITRLSKSKDLKKFVSASPGDMKALKPSPKGPKTQKTKLSAIPKETEKKILKVKLVKQIPSNIHPSEANSKDYMKIGAHISSPTTGKNNKRRTNLRNSLVPQGQKTLGKVLLKNRRSTLSITKTPATASPNISRSTKTKQINVISSEKIEETHPLPGRDKTQTTKILSPSKKAEKKKTVNETSELISSKVSPNTSARLTRHKSLLVSPKMTKVGRSTSIKKFILTSPRSKKALKPTPRGYKMQESKFSAKQKETEKKKTIKGKSVKQILSKIHPSKPNSKLNEKIDKSISSAIKGRSKIQRNSLGPRRQRGKSKQLSGRQNNNKRRFTDVSKSASLGTMPNTLIPATLRSPKGTGNVSFKKTDQVYTLNKSLRKSQQHRNISTVRPFNLTSEYASNQTISPSQFMRTRETHLMIDDTYAKQAQNIQSSIWETAQASPAKLQDIYEGLGRRSLLSSNITDSYYRQQTNRTSVTVPLDIEVARRKKDKISLFPEKARAESYVCNVSYTRNDWEDQLPLSRTTKSPQTSAKNVSYSEQSRQVSTSKVSFLSPIGNADDHTKYIAGTPFPVQGKSAVSRIHVDSARNSDSDLETISSSKPSLSNRQRITANLRISNPVVTHVVSERESDEESSADSYTKEGYIVEAEEEEKMYVNREEEEHEESQESTKSQERVTTDEYVEEIGKDDSRSLGQNPHAKQCIIS
ncbi:hypothetical protein BsWGS_04745 [Bradybaena similaris]